MGQVAIKVNGRTYRFECEAADQPRLEELAAYVTSRLENVESEHGNVGEARLLLMTALLIADDLWDATSGEPVASKPDAA